VGFAMFKRLMGCLVSVAVLAAAGVASAADLCRFPGPPPDQSLRPALPPKPVEPSCINPATHVSTCSAVEIKIFNAAVTDYNGKLAKFGVDAHAYADALNRWQRSVDDYASCEVGLLNHAS
jgi:hypothetical protein